jgi:hypothetical protein
MWRQSLHQTPHVNQPGELYDSGSCYWIVILELHEHVRHLLVLEVQIDDLPH